MLIVFSYIHHFNLTLIILMESDGPHIFVTFFSTQHLLDRDFLDHKLLLGGTAYLVHCLTAPLLIFRTICLNIYLICDFFVCVCCCIVYFVI